MSITKRTHDALVALKMPANLTGMEQWWEARQLNPTIIESFVKRLTTANPMEPEVFMLLGFQLAEIVNDPSFGLEPVTESAQSTPDTPERVQDKPHHFKALTTNSSVCECGRPYHWHMHFGVTVGVDHSKARQESERSYRERMGDPDALEAKRQRESANDDARGERDR